MLLETIEICVLRIDKAKLEAAFSTLYDENSNSYSAGQFISLVQNPRSAAFWPTAAPSSTHNPHQVAKCIFLKMQTYRLAGGSVKNCTAEE
jgi:hypothetical protein